MTAIKLRDYELYIFPHTAGKPPHATLTGTTFNEAAYEARRLLRLTGTPCAVVEVTEVGRYVVYIARPAELEN